MRLTIADGLKLLGLIASLGCATTTAATLAPGVQRMRPSGRCEA
jgi:hypothetical protein